MIKRLITIVLVLFVVSSIGYAALKELRPSTTSANQNASNANYESGAEEERFAPAVLASDNLQPNRIQVFYFHRTIRCTGCINVEEGAFEAVSVHHREEIENGTLEWHSINFDEEENKHYATEYSLYSQELILVEVRNGIAVRNMKIADVWEHWTSKAEITAIANRYIDEWLGGLKR